MDEHVSGNGLTGVPELDAYDHKLQAHRRAMAARLDPQDPTPASLSIIGMVVGFVVLPFLLVRGDGDQAVWITFYGLLVAYVVHHRSEQRGYRKAVAWFLGPEVLRDLDGSAARVTRPSQGKS